MSEINYKPLIAGIDTLEIGYCINEYSLSEEWDMLAEAKERAQSMAYDKEISSIILKGCEFMVHRSGAARSNYILSNEDIQVRIFQDARAGMYFPELRVVYRSPFLWRNGYESATKLVEDWVYSWADVTQVIPSRVDIMTDLLGPLPKLTPDLKEVVTRGRRKRVYSTQDLSCERYYEGLSVTGYRFGAKELSCRIYDKVLENAISHKTWFEHLWREQGWLEGNPVTRVEFQCRRKPLREMQIESTSDLINQIPDLWRYLVEEWLTIREIGRDSHRHRWPIHPFWQAAQSASQYLGSITGVTRIKQMRPKFNHLESQARGLLISMVAMSSQSLSGSTTKYGEKLVRDRIDKWMKDPTFEQEVEQRKSKYSSFEY